MPGTASLCSHLQAPLQSWLRPAMWIPGLRNLHCCRERWRYESSQADFLKCLLEAMNFMIDNDDSGTAYDFHKISVNMVRVFVYTWAEWLDVIEVSFEDNMANVISFSSGFLPLSIPFACILNLGLFWVPFYDNKFNSTRIAKLREACKLSVELQQ